MKLTGSILFVGLVLTVGCDRPVTVSHAVGGGPALIRDCEQLWAEYQATQKESWVAGDTNLPSGISALRPQVVQAVRRDGIPLIDIQLSGGFSHRGLMIILTNTAADYVPRKSSWTVEKIGDRIFEYRE